MFLMNRANTIHPSIQVTIDYPDNNANGRMPVLDTEQWMQEVVIQGERKLQIMHSHYRKPMANVALINKNSAISDRSKENILVADLVRIMRNISNMCEESERKSKIQFYINRLQYSGYESNERVNIYKKAKSIHKDMIRKDNEGITPM